MEDNFSDCIKWVCIAATVVLSVFIVTIFGGMAYVEVETMRIEKCQ